MGRNCVLEELVFQTSKSMEEIEESFKDFDLFTELMKSLNEALELSRGKTRMGTMRIRNDPYNEQHLVFSKVVFSKEETERLLDIILND